MARPHTATLVRVEGSVEVLNEEAILRRLSGVEVDGAVLEDKIGARLGESRGDLLEDEGFVELVKKEWHRLLDPTNDGLSLNLMQNLSRLDS